MKALVIGASGQIGEHTFAALAARGVAVTGTYLQHPRPELIRLDVTDAAHVASVMSQCAPDVVFLMGCQPNVDYCESHPDETHAINVGGARNVVLAANAAGARVVFMSSDYVFDGTAGPYSELDLVRPLNVYGWQKVASEALVAESAKDWLIVRTTGVFSWESQGKNFVDRLRRTIRNGEPIKVPMDQVSTPTYAPDVVDAILALAEKKQRGVFHVSGSRLANRYEFALAAAELFELDARLIVPVTTEALGQKARRPLASGLCVDKVERVIGRRLLDYVSGLREMVKLEA